MLRCTLLTLSSSTGVRKHSSARAYVVFDTDTCYDADT